MSTLGLLGAWNWEDALLGGWASVLRTAVTGVLAYAALILLLRQSGKRTLSKFNAFDLVVTVALSSTLATVILSESVALAQGVVGFAVLVSLQFAITWLSVRSRRVREIVKGEPALLLHRGEFLDQAMRRERVTREEVQAAARERGVESVTEIASAMLETDGSITVVRRSPIARPLTGEDVRLRPGLPEEREGS
jgi:uncharacterized membrane protein YcaP (DUF421 family)